MSKYQMTHNVPFSPDRRVPSGEGKTMAHLIVGNQVFHNGVPVELLYRVAQGVQGDTWRVRPLFVVEPERDDMFRPADRISFLHISPRRARAA
jgi:hypothetical protein